VRLENPSELQNGGKRGGFSFTATMLALNDLTMLVLLFLPLLHAWFSSISQWESHNIGI
jgi:hypothetical protein